MRWPNRRPHVLTPGMRREQRNLGRFLPLIDWTTFRRTNRSDEVRVLSPSFRAFACADSRQAVIWLLRTDRLTDRNRLVDPQAQALPVTLELPDMGNGRYTVIAWNTREGRAEAELSPLSRNGLLAIQTPPVVTDLALAVRPET